LNGRGLWKVDLARVLSKNSNGGNALHFLGLAFRNDWPFSKNFSLQNDAEGSIAE